MKLCTLALLCLLLSSCAGKIPVVGFNEDGEVVTTSLNERQYMRRLTRVLKSSQETIIPALATEEGEEWKLRTAVLGFYLKVAGGIGPLKASIKPGIRFAFSRGDNPPIP